MAMVPRPAATLILLREGMEVLMLQRTQNAAFLGGAYVFPGGSLDPAGRRHAPRRRPHREAGQRALQLESGAIAYYVAAIRECFEEAGILLARDRNGDAVTPSVREQLTHWRKKPFRELLEPRTSTFPPATSPTSATGSPRPALAALRRALLRRARAEGQRGSHDAGETVHDVWITPREALERGARGEIELVTRRRPR